MELAEEEGRAAHDVGGYDSLVVLAAGDLAQVEEVPDDSDQESVLLLLHHAAADAADRPAQRVECPPAPLLAVQLRCMQHMLMHLFEVQPL